MKREEKKTDTGNREFKEAESWLIHEIIMIETGDMTVESLMSSHSFRECMYERVISHIKDGCSDVAKACKRYIECAANYDKLKDAENEIKSLLHVAERDDIGSKNMNPKEDAALIVKMYAPVQDCLNPLQDDNHKESADIQRMKYLLDIIDRHRKGELTSEDVTILKENSESWRSDIGNLAETIRALNMDLVV